jgi:hypothetical protein
MSEKKRLNPEELDVDSLEVEELDQAAGGLEDVNQNCYSCTCPAPKQDPMINDTVYRY